MEPREAIQALDVVVARVTGAEPHAGARAKSSLLALDLGPRGTAQSPLPVPVETAQELVGAQVACAIGRDDVIVLAVHSHAAGVVVLTPAQEVEEGSPVA